MAKRNAVMLHAQQLLDDKEVQDAAWRVIEASRDSYRRIRGTSAQEALADEKLRRRLRQAIVAVWDLFSELSVASSRRRGRRWTKFAVVGLAGAGLVLAVNADARAVVLSLVEQTTNAGSGD
jgi:hypothetical protein